MSINFYCSSEQVFCYFENLRNGKKIRFGGHKYLQPGSCFFQFPEFEYLNFLEIGDWINFWNRSYDLRSFYGRENTQVEFVERIEEEFECFEGCDLMFHNIFNTHYMTRFWGKTLENFNELTDEYFLAVCNTARYSGDFSVFKGEKDVVDFIDYKFINVIYEFLGKEKGEFSIREDPVYERWKSLEEKID